MKLPHSFYEDSVRCDFFIPSMTKRTWAAGIEILSDLDEVCRKHNIEYFAEWGTLLGCIRHAGFIPWDDDIDICMKRDDYNKFLSIAEKELPEGYKIVNYKTSPDFKQMLSRIVNTDHYRFDGDFMAKFSGLPFAIGIDIFPLDYLSDDEDFEQNRFERLFLIQSVIDKIEKCNAKISALSFELTLIETNCKVKLERSGNLPLQLRNLSERIHAEVPLSKAKYITLYDLWFSNHDHKYPVKFYEHSIRMPFENITLPVPLFYDDILKKKYGASYMTPVRNGGAHNYPCFQIHLDVLKKHFNYEWPNYSFTDSDINYRKNHTPFSFDSIAAKYIEQLLDLHKEIDNVASTSAVFSSCNDFVNIFTNCQSLAIELGTLIEQRYFEGSKTVSLLEQYCEALFEFNEKVSTLIAQITDANNDTSENKFASNCNCSVNTIQEICHDGIANLDSIITEVNDSFKAELMPKRIVLFISSNASTFSTMEAYLHKCMSEDNFHVKVMPIPRFEIAIDMSGTSAIYDYDDYDKSLPLIDYTQYDLNLHPDEIVINYPYDEYNLVSSVDKLYYSRNLINYTDKLTYIPFFDIENIPTGDERSYITLKSFLKSPAIALCDVFIVPNESVKNCFIRLLNELTNNSFENVWDEKLSVFVSDDFNSANHKKIISSDNECTDSKNTIANSSSKKTILYYVGINSFLSHREKMITKLEKSLELFATSKAKIDVILVLQNDLISSLEKFDPEMIEPFNSLCEKYTSNSNIKKCAPENANLSLANLCDAYYGEASFYVPAFTNLHKPVMLHNPEVY